MSLFSKFVSKLEKKSPAESKTYSFGSIDYTIPTIPCLIEKKNEPWVYYGEDNLYPVKVSDLRNGSAIHNSIIKTKTKMTAGDGFLINEAKNEAESLAKYQALPTAVKTAYDLFIKNPNNPDNLERVKYNHADDLQTHGQFCYEVMFNTNHDKIVRMKYVNVEQIRAGKMEGDKVKSYWYCRDWSMYKKPGYKPVEIHAFDPNDKEHMNQLIFEKVGKQDYYGELPYKGALTWIMVDFKMGIYHLSGIDNGMNPGMHFKFYKLPGSEAEKQEIINQLDAQYRGALKTNKRLITFSNGKELAMEVDPIQVTNLDKQLLLLAELADKKILTGHQLTSPLLAGLSTSGQLGGNTELKTAGVMFDNMSMLADRNFLASSYQKVLDFNKVPIKLEINPFDLFKVRQTQTIV